MKKFRIPQEVQIEDRIFGPITMRRLIILTVGGGITYMIYLLLQDLGWAAWFFPVFILGSFTLALAFLEPFGMRFEKFLLRVIEFFSLPKTRVWDKRFSHDIFFKYIDYSHKKWTNKEKNAEPLNDIIALKKQQQKTVSGLSSLLENDLSKIDVSGYNKEKKK